MISIHEPGTVLRFLTVGAVNTLFGIGTYWLMLYADFNYQWAMLFSLMLGIVFSFNTHRLLVFKTKGGFVRYVFAWLLIYVVNIAFMSVIRDYTGDYFTGIALIPVNIALSFVLMKHFVFRLVMRYRV